MTNVISFLVENKIFDNPIETDVLLPSSYNQNEIHFIKANDKEYVFNDGDIVVIRFNV